MAEEFFDDDEFDALFQEQGVGSSAGGRETDASESGPVEDVAEAVVFGRSGGRLRGAPMSFRVGGSLNS
ncbi:hypothetical protein [Streptomyces sp. 3211]|uniref:hypothetical protein n=1 Tax=Streptomyces sp. 3211 TaxID=1964449 RepID=UPI0013317250